jgi:hypothetical protein
MEGRIYRGLTLAFRVKLRRSVAHVTISQPTGVPCDVLGGRSESCGYEARKRPLPTGLPLRNNDFPRSG